MSQPGTAKGSLEQSGRLVVLDVLRLGAALAVAAFHLIHHAREADGSFASLDVLARFGYLGVQVFFVLSGFVILWSALDRSPADFAVSRAVRLYPSFLTAVLLTAAATAFLAPEQSVSAGTLLKNALLLPMLTEEEIPMVDPVYWTLLVEVRFYALIFLLLLFRQSARVELWLGLWLVAVVACTILPAPEPLKSLCLQQYGIHFIAGCHFFLAWQRGFTRGRVAALLVCLVFGCATAVQSRHWFISRESLAEEIVAVLVMAASYGIFALIAAGKFRHLPQRWATAGTLSYPLYLTHNAIGKALFARLGPEMNSWLRLTIVLAVTGTVAVGITLVIENRLVPWLRSRLRRFLRPGADGRAVH